MKIIITGANGFIGSVFMWEMNNFGFSDLIGVDSVPLSQRNLLRKRSYSQFLLKDELWSYLGSPEGQQVDWIIHLGACSSTTEKNWDFLKENNLEYSQRIFEWCTKNGKNLIYASSGATYGDGSNGFSDRTPPQQFKSLNLYGESKLLMDKWALDQAATPPHWYGVRFFNVFGPNEYLKGTMASVVFKATQQIKETQRIGLFKSYHPQFKDGEQLRDFVYVKDITRWMHELMTAKPNNGIYNMGYGKARTWLDLGKATFSALNLPPQIDWLEMPEDLKGQYQYFTQAEMEKWQEAQLSPPQWPLELAIHDYIENYLNQEDPWL